MRLDHRSDAGHQRAGYSAGQWLVSDMMDNLQISERSPALPSKESFLSANYHLDRASEQALLVHWMAGLDNGNGDYHKQECLKNLRHAAEKLGYELVERLEGKDMRQS